MVPGDLDTSPSIYLFHTPSAQLQLAVVDHNGRDVSAPAQSPTLSKDGRFVAFTTMSDRLNPADSNGQPDVYRADRSTGKVRWISRPTKLKFAAQAAPERAIVQMCSSPAMSADGSIIAFASSSPWLVQGDQNRSRDIFLWTKPSALAVAKARPPAPPPERRKKSPYPKLPNGVEITPRVALLLAEYYNFPYYP